MRDLCTRLTHQLPQEHYWEKKEATRSFREFSRYKGCSEQESSLLLDRTLDRAVILPESVGNGEIEVLFVKSRTLYQLS